MENEKIKKVLFNEVSLSLSVVGVVLSAVFWIVNPQQDLKVELTKLQSKVESAETVTAALERIKNNDLHELQLRLDRVENRQIEQLQSSARLEALLIKEAK